MMERPDNRSLYRSTDGYGEVLAHYDQTLEAMTVAYEARYVDTAFGSAHVIVSGSPGGEPIVLWHGQNANAASWAHWIPALATTYRIYAVDVIGGMGKSAPTRPSKRGSAYGRWASEVMGGLELRAAHMIGASQGSWLIVKLANVAPQTIASAVLMSAAGFLPVSLMQTMRMLPRILFKPPAEAAQAMLALLSAPDVAPDPFFLKLFELMMRHFRSEALVPVLSDNEIRALTAPTYLLVGQYESAMNPYRVIERGLGLLPNLITAEVVPGVGHSMVHQQPDWVTSRARNFLARHPADSPH